MYVAALGPTTHQQLAETAAERRLDLGQDAFLKLLLTQLKYQDPMEAMDDREFMAQLAQFTSLSELQKLNQAVSELASVQSLNGASALIGKRVSALDSSGQPLSGTVEAALLREGEVYLRVAGTEVALKTVREVNLGGS
ncbi:MAG: flagellar hook capping protein [Anaerolineae bacterium]|nr:flagellar hook capping protein [Anaerolineae bacterium]